MHACAAAQFHGHQRPGDDGGRRAAVVVAGASPPPQPPTPPAGGPQTAGKPGHVFVINLENKGYDKVWGAGYRAPYLSQTLRSQGVLLSQYYGIAHNFRTRTTWPRFPGRRSNADDPRRLPDLRPVQPDREPPPGPGAGHRLRLPGLGSHRRRPAQRRRQDLEGLHGGHAERPASIRSWAPRTTTRAPRWGTSTPPGTTRSSTSRRSPRPPDCQSNVVDFSQLAGDLTVRRTPRPTCPTSRPTSATTGTTTPASTAARADWPAPTAGCSSRCRRSWTPPRSSRTACWSSPSTSPRATTTGPVRRSPAARPAAGSAPWCSRPFTKGGTTSDTLYNHFSLLASIEDIFSLPRLGYAGAPGPEQLRRGRLQRRVLILLARRSVAPRGAVSGGGPAGVGLGEVGPAVAGGDHGVELAELAGAGEVVGAGRGVQHGRHPVGEVLRLPDPVQGAVAVRVQQLRWSRSV